MTRWLTLQEVQIHLYKILNNDITQRTDTEYRYNCSAVFA